MILLNGYLKETINKMGEKYYFIFYECTRCGWKPKELGGQSTGSTTTKCQKVTDEHPLDFQLKCNEKYGQQHDSGGGYTARESYLVTSWNELNYKEYLYYKDRIG